MRALTKNFNFSSLSFYGSTLIEASAGTGKTHIIVMLYLCLILGIDNHRNSDFQILTIEKILVVTFTKIAVEELRERIRSNIREFRSVCQNGKSKNVFFLEILNQISDINVAYKRLLEAEKRIDQVQIFTIHSFCQNILNIYPIELKSMFRYTVLEDEKFLFERACKDFWRRYFYPLPIEIGNIIKEYWSDPQTLFIEICPYLLHNTEILIQPFLEGDIITEYKYTINYINYVKKSWNKEYDKLFVLFKNISINSRVYNKRNLIHWIENINIWSSIKVTKDYNVPKELKRFKYSVIIDNIDIPSNQTFQYSLFKVIEILFEKITKFRHLLINIAIRKIREIAKDIKNISSEISFSDLISLLDDALHDINTGQQLVKLIRVKYPVVIIDEFQDTDFQQYRIFNTLYSSSKSKHRLLLFGDPKQSIYSFRGADIFSYLLARKNVDYCYNLDINWRASKSMVNAINILFQFNSRPFVFENIPFFPMKSAKKNEKLHLVVNKKIFPALSFWIPDSKNLLSINEHQEIMAYQCAYVIRDLLNNANLNHVWLQNGKYKKKLESSDIVILVRDRNERYLMSSVLKKINISSIYLSNQEHIFSTDESFELLLILQAILAPENSNMLRCALMTKIIGYNAKKIDSINRNDDKWKNEFEEFLNYYMIWDKYGIQPMVQTIIFRRCTSKKILFLEEGQQSLVNILHLCEILQKKSLELKNKNSLIFWFSQQINSYDTYSKSHLLRLSPNAKNFIKIMTIHKAKGLEFPLVFLPFIPVIRKKQYSLFHNRNNYQVYLDLNNSLKNFNLYEEERLSEDLRMFYVAITRAIYHCFIGIGAVYFNRKHDKKSVSDIHRTALGYLVQKGIPGNYRFLQECLKKLAQASNGDIEYNFSSICLGQNYGKSISNRMIEKDVFDQKKLSFKDWNVSVNTSYKITSYTELHHLNKSYSPSLSNLIFEKNIYEKLNECKDTDIVYTPHTFPRGNISGNFLHHIFQKWNFKERISDEWLIKELHQIGIDVIWVPVIQSWMKMIVSTPLDNKDLMLSRLESNNYSTELKFYLSVDNLISSEVFNDICRHYDPISRLSPPLQFPDMVGMFHGFIDLFFLWKKKYYLVDYKSNWLGETYDSYVVSTVKKAMAIHQYALQYHIYTLALHRFLRNELINYNYEKNFGGVYYLFLRGVNIMYPGHGIYFCRPDKLLIDKLDTLLSS